MKNFKKNITVILSVLMLINGIALAGCVKKTSSDYDYLFKRDDGDIYIRYFKGGNDEKWLYKIADNFVSQTGIGVYLECDNEITGEIPTLLKNAHPSSGTASQSILSQLPDIAMTQTIKWQNYVNKGYIANIDDVYNYQYTDENNVTLKEKLISEAVEFGYMGQTPELAASGDKHYWVVPWTSPLTGIVYNVKMLKSLGGKWSDGHTPSTVSELIELVQALTAAGKTPFSWGGDGTNMGYWNFLFMSLWTSYQGYDTSFENRKSQLGSLKDFYNFADSEGNKDSSKEVFNQAGRKIALKILQDLIVDTANKTWKNSIKDPVSKTVYEAQDKFAFEEAAMIISGSWIKNEIAESIEEGFEYAMMPAPAVDYNYVQSVAAELGLSSTEIHGGLLSDGNFETANTVLAKYATINNTEIGDVMFIPENAVHKENAVKFLQYINSQSSVNIATETMGIARPFNYSPSNLQNTDSFTKSVFNIYETKNAVQVIRMSKSNIFTYAGIKEWADFNEADILLQLYNKSATQLIQEVYNKAEDNWLNWLEMAEVI
jgi:ABC-type glycerol-3-phosphate transport system substrate-binding protein